MRSNAGTPVMLASHTRYRQPRRCLTRLGRTSALAPINTLLEGFEGASRSAPNIASTSIPARGDMREEHPPASSEQRAELLRTPGCWPFPERCRGCRALPGAVLVPPLVQHTVQRDRVALKGNRFGNRRPLLRLKQEEENGDTCERTASHVSVPQEAASRPDSNVHSPASARG
jgi:hypothetical protein